VVLSEAFLTTEAILTTMQNIFEGLHVPSGNRLGSLPLLALEKALIILAGKGVGREEAHAKIRVAALEAIGRRDRGDTIDIEQLLTDPFFDACREEVVKLCSNPLNFTGRCVSQVRHFLDNELNPTIDPILKKVDIDEAKLDV